MQEKYTHGGGRPPFMASSVGSHGSVLVRAIKGVGEEEVVGG